MNLKQHILFKRSRRPDRRFPNWSFAAPESERLLDRLAESLDRNGFVVLDDFVPRDVADDIESRVRAFCVSLRPFIDARRRHETDTLIVNHDDATLDVTKTAKTIVDVRHGVDEGFLDLRNFQYALPLPDSYYERYLDAPILLDLLQRASGKTYRVLSRNMYVNEGVSTTRGFHYDDLVRTAKAFIYLTDVNELADGPFCYVRGSHNGKWLRLGNRYLNQLAGRHLGDCTIYDPRRATPFLKPKGTLIVSFQNGAHRGIPQAPGHRRVAFVNTFIPSDFR